MIKLIIFDAGGVLVTENKEDNEVRSTSVHHQFRVHALIKGLYAELGVPYLEYALDLKKPKEEVIRDLGIK